MEDSYSSWNGFGNIYFWGYGSYLTFYKELTFGSLIKGYSYHPDKTWMVHPLFQRTASGELYNYHNDHLGTPQQMVDALGNIVWNAQYSVFGKAHITIGTVENNLRFPGQYYDSEIGLHQNYFRDYDPSIGRYIESDPIGLKGGFNYYGYVGANPILYVDIWGLAKGSPVCIKERIGADRFITSDYMSENGYRWKHIIAKPSGVDTGLEPDYNNGKPRLKPTGDIVFKLYEVVDYIGYKNTHRKIEMEKNYKIFCTYEWTDECGIKQKEVMVHNETERSLVSDIVIDSEFIWRTESSVYLGDWGYGIF